MVKQTKTVNAPFTLENLEAFKFYKLEVEAHRLMPLTAAARDAMFPQSKLVCRYHVVGCRNRKDKLIGSSLFSHTNVLSAKYITSLI